MRSWMGYLLSMRYILAFAKSYLLSVRYLLVEIPTINVMMTAIKSSFRVWRYLTESR